MAYWPAIRPIFTTGTEAAYWRTSAIWSRVRTLRRTESSRTSAKVSAQSPPWSRKASPGDGAEARLQLLALGGDDERNAVAQLRPYGVQGRAVGPLGLLCGGQGPPGIHVVHEMLLCHPARASAGWVRAVVRKFSRSRMPPTVVIDSGWNWTPSTARVRWRSPIT